MQQQLPSKRSTQARLNSTVTILSLCRLTNIKPVASRQALKHPPDGTQAPHQPTHQSGAREPIFHKLPIHFLILSMGAHAAAHAAVVITFGRKDRKCWNIKCLERMGFNRKCGLVQYFPIGWGKNDGPGERTMGCRERTMPLKTERCQ